MYKKALVMGMGASGMAAAKLLLSEKTEVTIIDAIDNVNLRRNAALLRRKGARVVLGSDSVPDEKFDVCIVSPGISSCSKWISTVESRGIEVLSELELGASRCKCPMLAVTGSKGKSTMVKFCTDALSLAKQHVAIAGNYGPPLCGVVTGKKSKELNWVIVEVSSFQLEKVKTFKPHVGVLLNIQPDHLDRHGTMQSYATIKSSLFRRMGRRDFGIVFEQDLSAIRKLSRTPNRWISFGLSGRSDYRYADGMVSYTEQGAGKKILDFRGTIFANEVLGLTAAATVAAVKACGVKPEMVQQAAQKFRSLPHRMQTVAEIRGVKFINDSKATNLTALAAAVKMCDRPIKLIAGGLLKEKQLNFVKKILVKQVDAVYLIGKAARKMQEAWGDAVRCLTCGTLQRAVKFAWNEANKGDVVLLSPGCASFDQFEDFEDRGTQFIKIVELLKSEGVVK
ncbi:MAG: UDP-N-acetylmuramoyl-L-alanine--D-glutamate ligase [Kiritimatiellae bacterium]|nr:UDP-N-acetylmuramoyl-L-alanine--D-glutamate ligase [Kiritimatiellia bacterium]MDD5522209.1 UDP-N-acetylmuramoyl-L-alanine--D-glutamate ligase [Kiritimatiellia bacterium]